MSFLENLPKRAETESYEIPEDVVGMTGVEANFRCPTYHEIGEHRRALGGIMQEAIKSVQDDGDDIDSVANELQEKCLNDFFVSLKNGDETVPAKEINLDEYSGKVKAWLINCAFSHMQVEEGKAGKGLPTMPTESLGENSAQDI